MPFKMWILFSLTALVTACSSAELKSSSERAIASETSFESHAPYDSSNPAVRSYGRLSSIKDNDLKKSFRLSEVRNDRLYGIGMARGLNRELLLVGGNLYTSQMEGQTHVSRKESPSTDPDVSFFVFSEVSRWKSAAIPGQDQIRNFAELETAVKTFSENPANGINAKAPFPIRIRAQVDGLKWFIVGGMGNGIPSWQASFFRQRLLGGLENVTIEAFGFYVPGGNTIWTSKDSSMHIHFRTIGADDELFVGHIDEQLQIKGNLEIEIPG